MPIPDRIRIARENKKLSQHQLAQLAGLKQYQIARLETGTTKASASVLKKLAPALDKHISWFLEEESPEPGPLARLIDELQRAPYNALTERQVQALIDFFREFKREPAAARTDRPALTELTVKQKENAFKQLRAHIQEAKIHKLPVLTVEQKAAAGPGEYIESPPEQLVLAQHRWRKGYKPFKITGNSMEPFIMNGDYVVVDLLRPPVNGDTVLAQLDDGLVVKKFHQTKTYIELTSINPDFDPINGKTMSILGVLVDIVRPLKKV